MFLRKTFSVLPFESRQNKKWIMELALHFHKMTLVKVRKVSCFIKWKENTVRSLLNVVRGKKGNGKGQVVKKVCYLERKFLQQELSCSFIYLFIYLFIYSSCQIRDHISNAQNLRRRHNCWTTRRMTTEGTSWTNTADLKHAKSSSVPNKCNVYEQIHKDIKRQFRKW